MYQADDVIEGRYRLLKKIGAGAHGVVFRARDLESRLDVAIKFLNAEIGKDVTYMARLQREAQAMALLRGTSAVYVHGLRTSVAGTYLVMEYLQGRDLESYLDMAEQRGGVLKPDRMMQMLRPVIDTLETAHKQGVVHRDLKPANIFIVDRAAGGGVRLLDFGLVKMLDKAALTQRGQVAGTPSYIAPEAWLGNPLALDHRIDIYAIGVIVFRMLAGRVPHSSRGMAGMLEYALRGERPSLHALRPDVPHDIDLWVKRALSADPNARYQDIRSAWSALETVMAAQRPKK